MCSSAKLLLVALCGAVLASSALSVDASSVGVAAYRGGAVGSVAGAMQQQQAPAAAGQAAAAQMQAAVKASTAAYRDKPSLKDYYYGLKADEYAAPGAAIGTPGYSSQYPNPSYQAPTYTQPAVQPAQPYGSAAGYYPTNQQPQYPAYPQQPQPQPQPQPQYPQYQYPQQPYQQPEQAPGYYQQPAPAPYTKPAPYYTPAPKPHYYSKPAGNTGICQSEVFGAYYTQYRDEIITTDNELTGTMEAFMGCKDRTTLGGMCSYSCTDGNYLERFVGTTTKITTMPPQDWDSAAPYDHPVYCAWELGEMVPLEPRKANKSAPAIKQDDIPGFAFQCEFTIKAVCCDDIVPHVPYGGDVDLGGGDGDGCTDEGCDGGDGAEEWDCDIWPEDPCCTCDPETTCTDECVRKLARASKSKSAKKSAKKSTNGAKKSKSSTPSAKWSRGAKRGGAKIASVSGRQAYTTIGNDKVTGGYSSYQKSTASSAMQASSNMAAQPVKLPVAAPAKVPVAGQPGSQSTSVKVPMKTAAADSESI